MILSGSMIYLLCTKRNSAGQNRVNTENGTLKICRKSAVVYSSELVVTADLDKNTEDSDT